MSPNGSFRIGLLNHMTPSGPVLNRMPDSSGGPRISKHSATKSSASGFTRSVILVISKPSIGCCALEGDVESVVWWYITVAHPLPLHGFGWEAPARRCRGGPGRLCLPFHPSRLNGFLFDKFTKIICEKRKFTVRNS